MLPKIGNNLQKTEKHKTKPNNQSRKRQTRQKLSAIKAIKLNYPIILIALSFCLVCLYLL